MNGLLLLAASEIPDLLPPKPELLPSFWEQHGGTILIAVATLAVLVGVTRVWWSRRTRPVTILSPAETARQRLEAWQTRPENTELIGEVSVVLRRYLAARCECPGEELTTPELARVLASQPRLAQEGRESLLQFLRECDVRLFAPPPGEPSALHPVPRALELIAVVESNLQSPASAVKVPSPA